MDVSVRDFKAHLSRYLALAREGETLVITAHRRAVARVIGVPQTGGASLETLIATGAARWSGGKPRGAHIELAATGVPLSRIVQEERG